jgi:hypothetical protein
MARAGAALAMLILHDDVCTIPESGQTLAAPDDQPGLLIQSEILTVPVDKRQQAGFLATTSSGPKSVTKSHSAPIQESMILRISQEVPGIEFVRFLQRNRPPVRGGKIKNACPGLSTSVGSPYF